LASSGSVCEPPNVGHHRLQLANDPDLHQRWISNVETGKRNPSYGSLRRLAAGLDLTASQLTGHIVCHYRLCNACQSDAQGRRSWPWAPVGLFVPLG
jgi:transcriptional regulator with XRE-family HTH domain